MYRNKNGKNTHEGRDLHMSNNLKIRSIKGSGLWKQGGKGNLQCHWQEVYLEWWKHIQRIQTNGLDYEGHRDWEHS